MKIGQRLALRFTLVSALLTGVILTIIFVITRGVVHADFIERLSQQSRFEAIHHVTPNVKEVLPPETMPLVNPYVSIFSLEGKLLYKQGEFDIPESWIRHVNRKLGFNAERGSYTTVGRKVHMQGQSLLVFVTAHNLAGDHELDILFKAMTAGWMASLVLSYLIGLYFASNALEPVKHVVNEVNQITKDNLSYRLKVDKNLDEADEIDELILTFNALLGRIESAFITQKRFVQHASHELKTPLTAIMAEAELALARERNKEEYKRTLEVIVGETERLVNITEGLLTLAKMEEGSARAQMEKVDVNELVSQTIKTLRLHHPDRTIEETRTVDSVYITGNKELLQTALLNIMDNAIKYSKDLIQVRIERSKERVIVSVRDFGVGIPNQDVQKIGSPLYRGSNVVKVPGAGLGLALVERIIAVHEGKFQIDSTEGKGTTCMIILPSIKSGSQQTH